MLNSKYLSSRYLFIVFFTLAFVPTSNVFAQDITSGLTGHWKFDEGTGTTATDSSGSGNTGTLTNGPTWTTGKIEGALSFDGVDDHVNAGNPTSLNLSSSLTLSAWIYPNGLTGDRDIITKVGGGADYYFQVSNNQLHVGFANGGSWYSHSTTNASMPLSTWTHVAGIFDDSANILTIYINGVQQGSQTVTAVRMSSADPVHIGMGWPNQSWNGRLDEARIYNRALTASDIQTLYAYTGGPPDTQAPTTPTNLTASAISSSQINLSWTQSTDNIGVTGYRVYRGGTQVASPSTTSYSDTGLSPSTTYSYTVAAVDGAGNISFQSTSAQATTQAPPPPDTTPPSTPTNLFATAVSSSQINLSWSASTDNVGVTGYRVERCQGSGCTAFSQIATPIGTTYNDTGLTANTIYRYRVRAADAAGNLSGYSSIVGATTQSAPTGGGYTRVFYDGWESGNTNLWGQSDFRNKCPVVTSALDGGAVPHGTRMLRCNWNGVVAWNDPASFEALVLNSWNYSTELLVRFWVRTDTSDFNGLSGPKYFRIGTDSTGSTVSFMAMHVGGGQQGGFYNDTGQIGGTFWGGGSDAANGAWHEVELYVKVHASNGAVRLWEDGVMLWEATNTNTILSNGWTPFFLSSNWSGAEGCCDHDTNNHLYWDDFEIFSDSTSGTAATGNLSDASIAVGGTPPPPTTLVGDLNQDRTVNGADWSIMANVWFTNDATADINSDGIVNSIDFSLMNQNWGRSV